MNRRKFILVTHLASITAFAGCTADESSPKDDNDTESGTGEEKTSEDENEEVTETETDENGGELDENTEESSTEENEDDEGSDNEPDEDKNGEENSWESIDEIVLNGYTSGWEGVEPEAITDDTNPTLVLTEGKEYVITWKNGDGVPHNIEIWDENEEIVKDYETELMEEEGETQSLEIEATETMSEYVCEIHSDWDQRGDIKIETSQ